MKSPIGLNDGPLITLLIENNKFEVQIEEIEKVMLLEVLMQVMSHDAEEISSYEGNVTVKAEEVGLFVGKFIAKLTLITSLFFKLDGVTNNEEKVLVCVICK